MWNKIISRVPLTYIQTPVIIKNHSKSLGVQFTKIRAMSNYTTADSVPKVDLDESGVFKYIQIKVHDKNDKEATIIRGYKRCEYHSDIYEEVQAKLKSLDCEPIAGGRISLDPEEKKIHIYGYSQGYGKADHSITAKLVKDAYPGFKITISDEGY